MKIGNSVKKLIWKKVNLKYVINCNIWKNIRFGPYQFIKNNTWFNVEASLNIR